MRNLEKNVFTALETSEKFDQSNRLSALCGLIKHFIMLVYCVVQVYKDLHRLVIDVLSENLYNIWNIGDNYNSTEYFGLEYISFFP